MASIVVCTLDIVLLYVGHNCSLGFQAAPIMGVLVVRKYGQLILNHSKSMDPI